MHWTLGILRHFRVFSTPEQNPAFGVLSTPAPAPVTQTVGWLVILTSWHGNKIVENRHAMTKLQNTLGHLSHLYAYLENLLYYELSPVYDAVSWLVSFGQWNRWRKLTLAHVHGRRVLEVGFGTGMLLDELTRRGYWVCGLDISPAMHRITARRFARQNITVAQVRGIVQAMPITSHFCDTLISTFPATFILDPETIRETARVLSVGGRFILIDMCLFTANKFLQRLARGLGIQTEQEIDWLEHALAECGLSVRPINRQRKGLIVFVMIAER
ncbi:MAG: class I SAM-dependent methyltransferase [bacterium]|nr:class I SAM-dependent methyltransferase [bacterium]